MDKQGVVNLYNRTRFGHKKEPGSVMRLKLENRRLTSLKTKDHVLYDSVYMRVQDRDVYRDRKYVSDFFF